MKEKINKMREFFSLLNPAGREQEEEEEEIQRRRIDFNKLISIVTSG